LVRKTPEEVFNLGLPPGSKMAAVSLSILMDPHSIIREPKSSTCVQVTKHAFVGLRVSSDSGDRTFYNLLRLFAATLRDLKLLQHYRVCSSTELFFRLTLKNRAR